MAHYDSDKNEVIRWPSKECESYPGWEEIDCGCCNGLEWDGDYPTECSYCKGQGIKFHHKKTGTLAEYPGGSFLGRK